MSVSVRAVGNSQEPVGLSIAGNPCARIPCSSTPVGPRSQAIAAPRCCRRSENHDGPRNLFHFETQSHGPHAPCVRFAAGVTPVPRNTRLRLVARLCLAHVPRRDQLSEVGLSSSSTSRIARTMAGLTMSERGDQRGGAADLLAEGVHGGADLRDDQGRAGVASVLRSFWSTWQLSASACHPPGALTAMNRFFPLSPMLDNIEIMVIHWSHEDHSDRHSEGPSERGSQKGFSR